MNILKKLRKPYYVYFLTVLFFVTSCSETNDVENTENHQLELKDFINSNLKKSNIQMNVSDLKQYKLKNYDSLKQKAGINNYAKSNFEFEPYSIEITANNNVYNLHTIATSETHASIVIEDSDGILIETIEVDISNYNSINDEYEILWAKSNTNNSYAKTDYDVNDCKTGAATVAAAGRVIAFGSFFGCVPCAFVGGAITALGSIGFIACVATNS